MRSAMTPILPRPTPDASWLGRPAVHVLLYALTTLAFVGAAGITRRNTVDIDLPADRAPASPPIRCQVNPNSDPWWKLAALPEVGESLARRIVAYREKQGADVSRSRDPVFRDARDLQRVPGFGPRKTAGIEPLLTFRD
jgi:hypothetical protein